MYLSIVYMHNMQSVDYYHLFNYANRTKHAHPRWPIWARTNGTNQLKKNRSIQ